VRKLKWLLLSFGVLLLVLSSCGIFTVPVLTSVTVPDYVDPSKDLTLTWSAEGVSEAIQIEIFLNDVKIGEVSAVEGKYVIPKGTLDWGEEYTVKLQIKDVESEDAVKTATFKTYKKLSLYVVGYNSGPGVEGATVSANDGDFTATTDENGFAVVGLRWDGEPNEILIKKDKYALSGVKGLMLAEDATEATYKVVMKKALIDANPDLEKLPEATVEFFTDSSKATPVDLANVTDDPYVVVKANADHKINIIYAAAGKIPGAGFFGPRLYESATDTLEGTLDINGLSGKTEIHVVVYDYNDNRVDYVFYANIAKTGETKGKKYEPLKWSDYGDSNLDAYTRRSGIEFYSLPINPKKNGSKISKYDVVKPQAAPKDSNLWVEVWFIDYNTAAYYSLVSTDTTAPEAYAIYRSFDGVKWEKIAVTEEGLYRDADPRLKPGKKVYYKVSAIYPDGESTAVDLGYVVPLDVFNVKLESPADGATNVSRDPTFVWKPTNDVFSVITDDATYSGMYVYTLWVYDLVQSENHLVPLNPDTGKQLIIGSTEATEMSLKFSSVPWAIIVGDLGGAYYYPYTVLEPNKTYEWAVDLAYAQAEFEGGNMAYSIAIDEGYGADYFGVHGDIYNTFTTGQE